MIYVTHDQTEALTFADQVVVMNDGEVVQIGTPVELFERPEHTFVGHFIGSPGMNVLPCEVRGRQAHASPASAIETANAAALSRQRQAARARRAAGIRHASPATGIPVDIVKVPDAGRYRIVETRSRRAARSSCSCRRATPIPTAERASPLRSRRTRRSTTTAGW